MPSSSGDGTLTMASSGATVPSLFAGTPAALLDSLQRSTLTPGTVLVAEGDYPGKMYVLLKGRAEVVVAGRDGREHVVHTPTPGEPIGEMSLLTGLPASATVRTTEESEVLHVRAEDLSALGQQHPVVYRNLMAILASRLAGTNRLAVGETPSRTIVLDDRGAPDRLPYALACSIAWHTRTATLLVTVDEDAPAPTLPLSRPTTPRVDVISSRRSTLDELLASARHAYETVLVRVRGGDAPEGDRVVRLGPPGSADSAALSVEAWVEDASPMPPRDRIVRVPPLGEDDARALETMSLPNRSPAGAAVGWLARELTGLRVGVALGAGSSRGYAHIGALKALEQHCIPIDCLAGTSIGSIVAALYAHLGDLEAVSALFDELGERVFRPTLSRRSLMSTRSLRRFVARNLGDGLIEDLPIPVAIVTADLMSGEEVVLQRGSIANALFAAMAVPGIFPPVGLGRRVLVDGGLLDPLPMGVAAEMGAGVVVGVKLSGGPGTMSLDEVSEAGEVRLPSVLGTIMRAIELVQTHVSRELEQTATIVVTPETGGGTLRNFKSGRRFIEAGYESIEDALPRLSAAMPWLQDDHGA
jgi:NTE family protein